MLRRILLMFTILAMCAVVIFGGVETFLKSSSVLKVSKNLSESYNSETYLFVDITDNRMSLYKNGVLKKSYPISSGKRGSPSPIGTWTIIGKDTWGEGFGGRWLGFNVPWGKYGIHGTNEPWTIGMAGSHGCIRMNNKDVAELYKMVHVGTEVCIYGGPNGPFGEGFRILTPGDRGADVYELQKRLKKAGYFHGYINGIYGEDMKAAVHAFQKKNKMYVTNLITMQFYARLGIELFD